MVFFYLKMLHCADDETGRCIVTTEVCPSAHALEKKHTEGERLVWGERVGDGGPAQVIFPMLYWLGSIFVYIRLAQLP